MFVGVRKSNERVFRMQVTFEHYSVRPYPFLVDAARETLTAAKRLPSVHERICTVQITSGSLS